jgi:Fe-S cluster biogenesis protein NfuA
LETERQVNELIETYARPHAQSDGGDIAFLRMDHDTGVVHVTMKGACVSCSSSTITLKFMVLKLLQNYLDGITDVEGHDEEESEESDELW